MQAPTGEVSAFLDDHDDQVFVVNPPTPVVTALVEDLAARDNPPETHVLAADRTLNTALSPYWVDATASDLIDAGILHVHSIDTEHTPAFVAGNYVASIAFSTPVSEFPGDTAATDLTPVLTEGTIDTDQEALDEILAGIAAEAPAYNLYTPPLSDVVELLEDHFDADVSDDFHTGVQTAYDQDFGLDSASIAVLLGGFHELQYHDLGLWAEVSEFASRATLSRAKTTLEDQGILTTEDIETEMGRPRQRLLLTEDYADIDDFIGVLEAIQTRTEHE